MGYPTFWDFMIILVLLFNAVYLGYMLTKTENRVSRLERGKSDRTGH